jgi:hypothetical protein
MWDSDFSVMRVNRVCVVKVCLRLVPRCVSTGPVVVHLAENVNVNTKDSPTEYMTPSPGEADAARPPRVRGPCVSGAGGARQFQSRNASEFSLTLVRLALIVVPSNVLPQDRVRDYYLRAFCERSLGPRVVVPSRPWGSRYAATVIRPGPSPGTGGGAFPSKD